MTPDDLAHDLIGTCQLRFPEEELATKADLIRFDSLAFLCSGCNWWHSTVELNNESSRDLCDECNEEVDDT